MTVVSPERPRPPATRPRRVSPQRYLLRRVTVVLVLAGLVISGIVLADALTSNDATPAAEAGTDVGDLGSDDAEGVVGSSVTAPDSSEAAVGASTVADETLAPTAADPTSGGPIVPSAATPAKVLIAGDSDAGTFGPYLVTLLEQTGVVETTLDYKVSSGLARPDFYDWPAHFGETIATLDPDIIVVTFGGNDAQGLSDLNGQFLVGQPTGTTPEGSSAEQSDAQWRAEYGKRVGQVMDLLTANGRTLVWVGIPNDDDEEFTARLSVQNDVVRSEAAKHPGVIFIDTWSRFSGRDGNWAEYVIDPRDGQGKDVRSDVDGFHLNENGAEILALDIAEAVRTELRSRGAVF